MNEASGFEIARFLLPFYIADLYIVSSGTDNLTAVASNVQARGGGGGREE